MSRSKLGKTRAKHEKNNGQNCNYRSSLFFTRDLNCRVSLIPHTAKRNGEDENCNINVRRYLPWRGKHRAANYVRNFPCIADRYGTYMLSTQLTKFSFLFPHIPQSPLSLSPPNNFVVGCSISNCPRGAPEKKLEGGWMLSSGYPPPSFLLPPFLPRSQLYTFSPFENRRRKRRRVVAFPPSLSLREGLEEIGAKNTVFPLFWGENAMWGCSKLNSAVFVSDLPGQGFVRLLLHHQGNLR